MNNDLGGHGAWRRSWFLTRISWEKGEVNKANETRVLFFFSNYETDSGNRFSAPVNVSTPVSAPTAAPRALHTNKINQAYTYQRRHWITEAVKRHAGIIAMSLFPSSKLHKRPWLWRYLFTYSLSHQSLRSVFILHSKHKFLSNLLYIS